MSDKYLQDKIDWLQNTQRAPEKYLVVNLEKIPGVGDKIYSIPALRAIRKKYPEKRIVAVVNSFWSAEIFANCPYIDYLIESPYPVTKNQNVDIMNLEWSFYEHHQTPHQVLTYLKHTTGDDENTADLTLEMFQSRNDFDHINQVLSTIPRDKPWVAIWPAFTMKSRDVSKEAWQNIVNKLKDEYHVLSFGSARYDYKLDGVIDLQGKFKINQIPPVLDLCIVSICSNTGSLPISGCSKTTLLYLNAGQYPANFLIPFRNGKLGYNCIIVEHTCEHKQACFQGHLTLSEWNKQNEQHKQLLKLPNPNLYTALTAWFYHFEPNGQHCEWQCAKQIGEWIDSNVKVAVDYIMSQKRDK